MGKIFTSRLMTERKIVNGLVIPENEMLILLMLLINIESLFFTGKDSGEKMNK